MPGPVRPVRAQLGTASADGSEDGATVGVGFAVGLAVGFGVGLGVGLGVARGLAGSGQLLTPEPATWPLDAGTWYLSFGVTPGSGKNCRRGPGSP